MPCGSYSGTTMNANELTTVKFFGLIPFPFFYLFQNGSCEFVPTRTLLKLLIPVFKGIFQTHI